MDYVISREEFLKLKEYQKSLVGLRREVKKSWADYSRERQSWWNKIPEARWGRAYDEWQNAEPSWNKIKTDPTKEYTRAFNILYGLLKGKPYEQIERKTDKENKCVFTRLNVEFLKVIKDFNLNKEALKPILDLVPFAWK